jgi:hypothetical protein
MSRLLDLEPYGARDDKAFMDEMNALTRHHLAGCEPYARIWKRRAIKAAARPEDLPFMHVGLFKQIDFKTQAEGIRHEHTLMSSATTSSVSSQIHLDTRSSELQGRSNNALWRVWLGEQKLPLVVVDSVKALQPRGGISARIAAAMSLRTCSNEIHFLLERSEEATSIKRDAFLQLLERHGSLILYGFTWILWQLFGEGPRTAGAASEIRTAMRGKRISFVHSGGWKKLEAIKVAREKFDATLTDGLETGSRVIDFYGLVEQVGVIYPLCEAGYRHVPVWAEVIVRDPWALTPLEGEPGQLQLMNTLAWGSPYQNVLTEDIGVVVPGACPCGRSGRRFELRGRMPRAELRGCANV